MFKFKSKMIIAVILVFGITAIVSCGKNEKSIKKSQQTTYPSGKRVAVPGPKVTIKAKPYRATTDRKRDHKNCGCKQCFGICDVSISIGIEFTKIIIVPDTSDDFSRIYFTEELPNFDAEFGIDTDLTIPSQALENTGINSLILKTGIYEFFEEQDEITVGSDNYATYGYVDVESIIN